MVNIPMTDAELDRQRRSGMLVCQCERPIWEPVYGSYQCGRCYRKISGT
jgi:hypothetical protein